MSDKKNPSLSQGSDFSGKSTANTRFSAKQKSDLGRKLVQELVDSGIPINLQHLLKYKYVSKEEAFQLMGYKYSGWVVPYLDLDGKPYLHDGKPFYRIKPDAGQISEGKYRTMKGAGNRPYFSPLLKEQNLIKDIKGNGNIIFTEGEKKTDSLVSHGFTTIGLAGVWSWTDGRVDKYQLLPELEAISWRGRNVVILFDSDVVLKDQVQQALKELSKALTKKGAKVKVATLPCDLDGTKNGADDFLVKYGREALHKQVLGSARESHDKNKRFIWTDEPIKSHHVAVLASITFRNFYALRPDIGLYKWVGTRWKLLKRKPKDTLLNPLHKWLDGMNWVKRENHHLGSVISQVLATIEHTEWDSNYLMSFKNGTLDINKKEFYRGFHDRKHYLTHSFDFNYSPEAKCPTWIKFLNETFNNNQEKIELLRAAFKWSIFPKENNKKFILERLFDLYGRRGSGKSTVLEILEAVAGGSEACGGFTAASLSKTELFPLIGKKIAYDSDSSGHIKEVGKFNRIISNETVLVKELFFNETHERLNVVCWRAFNDNQSASGGGVEGLARRLVTFKFDNVPKKINTNLLNELLNEIEGIFWWCWSMDDNLMFDVLKNIGNCSEIAEANIENMLENQPVVQFIFDYANDQPIEVNATDLYKQFISWSDEVGIHSIKQTKFGRELKKLKGFVDKGNNVKGVVYKICKKSEINLAEHFGFSINEGLNHSTCRVDQPNPSASNPPIEKKKEKSMNSLNSLVNKNIFKNKKDNSYIKKESKETLQTLQPSIIEDQPATGSSWDTASDDEDPFWNQ